MKVYTYSTARAKLSSVLEESKTEEIIIKRRNAAAEGRSCTGCTMIYW